MYTKIALLLAALFAAQVCSKPSYGYDNGHHYSHDDHDHLRYHGPTAVPHVLHDGHIADTHEVAAAKTEHFAAVAKAHTHGGYADHYGNEGYNSHEEHAYSHDDHDHLKYHGPTAIPHVLHNGHIADTHEVAAAKAEHFAAVSKAQTHGYGHESSGNYASGHEYKHHVVPYHGPLAKPVVLKSGYLADTHEVAAAKQHHLETLHSSNYGH